MIDQAERDERRIKIERAMDRMQAAEAEVIGLARAIVQFIDEGKESAALDCCKNGLRQALAKEDKAYAAFVEATTAKAAKL
jgi:hypothetical protein